jgi:hypothetical protein
MAAKRISIAALCNDQPRRLPTAAGDSGSLGSSSSRRPSGSSSSSSSSDASSTSVAHFHGSSPTTAFSAAYDPIRDAHNRHDDPQSTRPISSLSPTTLPPPSAHIRKPPLAPTQHTSGPHFTPIAPRPDPASLPLSITSTSTSSASPLKPPEPPNAPSARLAQQHTRHLAIPPTTRYNPYPQQPSKHTLAYSIQVSPSSRTDLRSNNGPIAFEFWNPNNAAGSSNSRRSSKSKANHTFPSSSSVGKPGSTNMSAHPKKSKSKSKPVVVGQEEASNTSAGGLLSSNARGEVIPNTAASGTSPSTGGRPPTPGAASNANSTTMDDALDIEMELLNALGGDEETLAEPASLGARGLPIKLDSQPTTAEDDLLEEVEAMERAAAHKPARQTPFMSSPMKHEPEEGDAMEIDLKVRNTNRSIISPLLNISPFFASIAIHALPLARRPPPALATPLARLAKHSANSNPHLRTPVSTHLGLTVASPHTFPRTYANNGS